MGPLELELRRRLNHHRKLLAVYLMAGDPSVDSSVEIARAAIDAGADLLEVGIPYSDPLADGPVIQAAGQRSLQRGFRLRDVWKVASSLRETGCPLVVMTYFNPVLQYGVDRFCKEAAESGFSGLLVPDLPPEEATPVLTVAERCGLAFVPFVAPTSTPERIRLATSVGSGFVYCISLTGVTGIRDSLSERAKELVGRVRTITSMPVLVGFGISSPEHARQACTWADGVVVGSALVHRIAQARDQEEAVRAVRGFIEAIRSEMDQVQV